jgi:hypothetical protein
MTNTTAVLLPVQPGKVRNAIMNVLGRHGVSQATAESIWHDLTTGNDPRPANLPEEFHYRGIKLTWPQGRYTRAITPHEVKTLNSALRARGVRESELCDPEDTCETARWAFTSLFTHMSSESYNPEPVRAAELRELVEEATAQRREVNAPVLVFETVCPFERDECMAMQDNGEGECDTHPQPTREELLAARSLAVLDHAKLTHADDDASLCWDEAPSGKRCLLDNHHGGKHKNGKAHWNGKRTSVQIVTTPERTVDAQVITQEGAIDIDSLLADIKALASQLEESK